LERKGKERKGKEGKGKEGKMKSLAAPGGNDCVVKLVPILKRDYGV
jgi:hypothetical protein